MSEPIDDAAVENLCEVMHDAYEAAAKQTGWETQERSRKPWADVPEENKATMRIAVAALRDTMLDSVLTQIHAERRWQEERRLRSSHLDTKLSHAYTIQRLDVVDGCIKALWDKPPSLPAKET